ncbi:hypothetical protein ACN47E_003494 [Coniothyrium glycines]
MSFPPAPDVGEFTPDIDDTSAADATSNSDPFRFSHGFSGVDQHAIFFLVHVLIVAASLPVLLVFAYRLVNRFRNIRCGISTSKSDRSQLFRKRARFSRWGMLKRCFLYAPLLTSRQHHKQSYLRHIASTSPVRPKIFIIAAYYLSNIAYCLAISGPTIPHRLAAFRGRCGTFAVFNLILTTLFALRNNPFISILSISYDTFNLFHRWAARLVILQSTAHVLAFISNAYIVEYQGQSGWRSVGWVFGHSSSYRWGSAAFVSFLFILLHSIRPIRHIFYEIFLNLHRIDVIIAVSGIYFHLAKHALPQLPWVYLIITFLVLELLARISRILYHNFSWSTRTWTSITLEPLPGDATRVTVLLPRSWRAKPGAHIHIYIPRLALLSSHPFSVAWSTASASASASSSSYPIKQNTYTLLPTSETPFSYTFQRPHDTPSLTLIVRARAGFTRKLYTHALSHPLASLSAAIEGPYHSAPAPLSRYTTILFFAAGAGITAQLLHLRQLLSQHHRHDHHHASQRRRKKTQKISLAYCVPHTNTLSHVRSCLADLVQLAAREECEARLRMRIYVSRMGVGEVVEEGVWDGWDLRCGRCDVQREVDEVLEIGEEEEEEEEEEGEKKEDGATAVMTCGPGSFNATVRDAVRRRVCERDIDLFEEGLSY